MYTNKIPELDLDKSTYLNLNLEDNVQPTKFWSCISESKISPLELAGVSDEVLEIMLVFRTSDKKFWADNFS